MPAAPGVYDAADVPRHPALAPVSNCEQARPGGPALSSLASLFWRVVMAWQGMPPTVGWQLHFGRRVHVCLLRMGRCKMCTVLLAILHNASWARRQARAAAFPSIKRPCLVAIKGRGRDTIASPWRLPLLHTVHCTCVNLKAGSSLHRVTLTVMVARRHCATVELGVAVRP